MTMKNPKFSLGIRIVAGCYLIYLAYQITKGGLLGKENLHGWQFAVALIGVIVFVVVGVVIAYQSSKALMEMQREEKLKAAEEAAEQAAQEAMWQQQSSSERFRSMKSLADLEAGELSAAAAEAAGVSEEDETVNSSVNAETDSVESGESGTPETTESEAE